MKYKLPSPVQIYGAKNILSNLLTLQQEMGGVRKPDDIEFIHQMRVASRRLRSAIEVFGPIIAPKKHIVWLSETKQLTKALGAARDQDVQIEFLKDFVHELPDEKYRPGIKRLIVRLMQKRQKSQESVALAIENINQSGVIVEMISKLSPAANLQMNQYNTPDTYLLAEESIMQRMDQLLSYESYIFDPKNIEQLHAMRIAAKHLRYTMEIFQTIYAEEINPYLQVTKKIQEGLGNIHDCDMWEQFLNTFRIKERQKIVRFYGYAKPINRLNPGLDYFQSNRQIERERLYNQFIQDWEEWKAQSIWLQMKEMLHSHCIPEEKLLPFEISSEEDSQFTQSA